MSLDKNSFRTKQLSFKQKGELVDNAVVVNSIYFDMGTIADYINNGGGSGTVTSVSVVSANGFAGTVATATTTPAITISTSITGLLKGNGTAISAASAGTDYQAPISLTTTGTSGAATFIANTLNIPQYQADGVSWLLAGNATGNDTSFLGTTDNHDILFKTNNTTRVTILKTGELGIGTTTPSASIHVVGTGATSATYTAKFQNSALADIMALRDDGNVGIGTDTPQHKLGVVSSASADGISVKKSAALNAFLGYYTSTGGALTLYDITGGSTLVSLNTNGNVDFVNTGQNFAIGTTSAANKLVVDSALTGDAIRMSKSGVIQSFMGYYDTGGSFVAYEQTGGTQVINLNYNFSSSYDFFNTGRNFGLGVTAPTAIFQVAAGTTAKAPIRFTPTSSALRSSVEVGALEFVDDGTTGHLYITVNIAGVATRVLIV